MTEGLVEDQTKGETKSDWAALFRKSPLFDETVNLEVANHLFLVARVRQMGAPSPWRERSSWINVSLTVWSWVSAA